MDKRMFTVAAQAANNHGIFDRATWLAAGLSDRQLAYARASGLIEAVGNRSFRFAGQPGSWSQQITAGLVDLGPEACLAGDTAARVLGLDGFSKSSAVTFALPRSLRNRRTIGEVRSMAEIRPIDVVERQGWRTLSAARVIIEESRRWTPDQLSGAIDSAGRLGLVNQAFLRRELDVHRTQGKRGVVALDQSLAEPPTESWLERKTLRVLKSAGLPMPSTQVVIRDGARVVARVDLMWLPEKLIVELNGHAFHSSRAQLQRDEARRTDLTLLGYRIIAFTYDDVTTRPQWLASTVRRALDLAA